MNLDLQKAVVEARAREWLLVAAKKAVYDTVQQLPANIELFSNLATAQTVTAKAEEALREAGLVVYEFSKEADGSGGDKNPIPGVKIQAPEKPLYEIGKAFEWAVEHKQAIIPASLNVKEFEAIVDAMKVKPDFVTMKVIPKATLAQDMAAVLEGVGE